jgi:hypothetical protein
MAMAIKSLKVFFLGTMLRKNVLANYIGLISSIIGSLISLPFYLSILGLSQYGLIAVILLIQILLNSLDFGLWQSMIREISIALKLPDGRLKTSSLVFNVEKLYWVFAIHTGNLSHPRSAYLAILPAALEENFTPSPPYTRFTTLSIF